MSMSQEFQLGFNLLKRFRETLEEIAKADSLESAKELIESVKNPVFGAMAQIKVGEGPMKEELLEPLAVVVAQFREPKDFSALKEAISQVINLVDQVEKVSQEESG